MTAEERTERLLLDIAQHCNERRFSHFGAIEFALVLNDYGIEMPREVLERQLGTLVTSGKLTQMGAPGRPFRFRITTAGKLRLDVLNILSQNEPANDPVPRAPVAEKTLDSWWNNLLPEMKANVFDTFMEHA